MEQGRQPPSLGAAIVWIWVCWSAGARARGTGAGGGAGMGGRPSTSSTATSVAWSERLRVVSRRDAGDVLWTWADGGGGEEWKERVG